MGSSGRVDLRRTRVYAGVRGQPEGWSRTMDAADDFVPSLCRMVTGAGSQAEVVFTGCGSSFHLAVSAAGLFQEATGIAARGVFAADVALAPQTVFAREHRYVVVGLSRSGETSETLAALRRAVSDGHPIACITARPGSTLASGAELPVVLSHADDPGVPAPGWCSNLLLAVQVWAARLGGKQAWEQELLELPAAGDAGLDIWEEAAQELSAGPPGRLHLFLGTGVYYGLAREGCLRMKELAREPAEAYHTLEYRHAPMAQLAPETQAILSAQRRTTRQEADLLADLSRAGARTIAVAEGAQALRAWLGIDVGSGLSDWARAPLHLLPLQLLALTRAAACGRDPDSP